METAKFKLAIIGLGYVGIPLARLFLEHDYTVHGIDLDTSKIQKLIQRQSYLSDFSQTDIEKLFAKGQFHVGTSYEVIGNVDIIILCVPTPLDKNGQPDLSYIFQAIESSVPYLCNGQLIVLESSTYPGTTEEEIAPLIESKGFEIGKDIFLAYSPERNDPGQKQFELQDIPKVVSGMTTQCTKLAKEIYETVFENVVVVSSPRIAEMTKLVENSQRFINISFMNELMILCEDMKINLWEVINAANTKPYGYTPYYPGPGIGGHCIPVDPLYLNWKAKCYNFNIQFIELAHQINQKVPQYVIKKVEKCLSQIKSIEKCEILVIGVTYKKDVNDLRESPALPIMSGLINLGVKLSYYDPFIEEIEIDGTPIKSTTLTPECLKQHNCTLILTDHSCISYELIVNHSPLVIDTKNATKHLKHQRNVVLL